MKNEQTPPGARKVFGHDDVRRVAGIVAKTGVNAGKLEIGALKAGASEVLFTGGR